MASAPRPPAAAATPMELLEQRYLAAIQAAEAAAAHVTDASGQPLSKLPRASPQAKFKALAEASSPLTPEDRGKLLQSLNGHSPPSRPITAATASRLAIWRSRLPYRIVPLAMRGLILVTGLGLGLLAWHRTPERWMKITGQEVLSTRWQLPNGEIIEGILKPGERYVLVRREGKIGLLRSWYPGRGYAETRVFLGYLKEDG